MIAFALKSNEDSVNSAELIGLFLVLIPEQSSVACVLPMLETADVVTGFGAALLVVSMIINGSVDKLEA